jgi:hypothetical protein
MPARQSNCITAVATGRICVQFGSGNFQEKFVEKLQTWFETQKDNRQ